MSEKLGTPVYLRDEEKVASSFTRIDGGQAPFADSERCRALNGRASLRMIVKTIVCLLDVFDDVGVDEGGMGHCQHVSRRWNERGLGA